VAVGMVTSSTGRLAASAATPASWGAPPWHDRSMGGSARLFVVARNPDPASRLPFLVRVPLPGGDLVLKAREPWPRTGVVYCHPAEGEWPDPPERAQILEQVPVRSCRRRGAAIDLVLDRAREHRSQLVFTRTRGREVIFWQSPRTARAARPGVRVPGRRASGLGELTILVDTRERYPWRFGRQHAVTLERRALPAGDYAVQAPDGELAAVVERKTLPDLASSLTDGSLGYLLAELAALPRAAVVVEDRYGGLFKLEHVQPGFVADLLGALAVRYPNVPVVFCDTRPLAQEWAYRFLGAAVAEVTRAARG
jgi:ERCC4 domain